LDIFNNRFPVAKVWIANPEKGIYEPVSDWIRLDKYNDRLFLTNQWETKLFRHPILLNKGVGVAEHHASVGAGTDKVTPTRIPPSLCH